MAAPPKRRKPSRRLTLRPLLNAAAWLVRFSRPAAASEALTLLLVSLALVTGGGITVHDLVRHRSPVEDVLWSLAVFALASAVRLSPWWRSHLRDMTADRARDYVGSLILLLIAGSISGHVLLQALGGAEAYPMLGPAAYPPDALAALAAAALVAMCLLLRIPVMRWLLTGFRLVSDAVRRMREARLVDAVQVDEIAVNEPEEVPFEPEEHEEGEPVKRLLHVSSARRMSPLPDNGPTLPSIDIFGPPLKEEEAPLDLEQKAKQIEESLASFNVRASVVGYHYGPVITQFDVQPDRGVKVRRITELHNDLALALAAPTIRIQAPVPGKPFVGIEVPNSSAAMVSLRDLLESEAYHQVTSPLRVVLGKDVAGHPSVIDLARMPHLLIAGATGAGKSVCVNALISCLLYQNTPEQVRLMMVDPKKVELTVYNGVPHLLSPVVTEMDKVVGVLQWAIREMERRYQIFADNTVRNIQRYNEKMAAHGAKPLPYIVLIVDELADLMMVSPEDVEDAICRLAQLARAAGIHLVIATQRPSVDVVTGLIKANFPARIAFMMTSQVDSRTILDTVGAEKLLGRGDMLYMPPDAPKPLRLQGAYVSDREIENLVEFWQRSPLQAAVERVAEEEFAAAEEAAGAEEDELLDEAIRVVREYQHASVSLLQRRMRIGRVRATRLMDELEDRRVVGPADGSKQRPVLPDGEEE